MRNRLLNSYNNHPFAFTTTSKPPSSKIMRFDTDSFRINIDNCCTTTITPNIGDFVGPVMEVKNKSVQGFNGQTSPVMHKGTVRWVINDDEGVARTITIPNTYHVPDAPTRLLSPQHWAQQVKDNKPLPRGTWCATYEDEVVLQWDQRKYTKTVKLDPTRSNVAIMWTAPGYTRYQDYIQLDDECPVCYETDGPDFPLCCATDDYAPDDKDEFENEPEEPSAMHEPADPNSQDKARDTQSTPTLTSTDQRFSVPRSLNLMT
jgi:hypothetical protein